MSIFFGLKQYSYLTIRTYHFTSKQYYYFRYNMIHFEILTILMDFLCIILLSIINLNPKYFLTCDQKVSRRSLIFFWSELINPGSVVPSKVANLLINLILTSALKISHYQKQWLPVPSMYGIKKVASCTVYQEWKKYCCFVGTSECFTLILFCIFSRKKHWQENSLPCTCICTYTYRANVHEDVHDTYI